MALSTIYWNFYFPPGLNASFAVRIYGTVIYVLLVTGRFAIGESFLLVRFAAGFTGRMTGCVRNAGRTAVPF